MVNIQADTAQPGFGFFSWIGDTSWLENPKAPLTKVNMPLADVSIQAQFAALPTYQLTVNNGSGSGKYLAGTPVLVKADAPSTGFKFDRWTGDISLLADPAQEEFYLQMPEFDVSLTANFKQADLISYKNDIVPIMNLHCLPACHMEENNTPLDNYFAVYFRRDRIVITTQSNNMPPSYPLSNQDKEIIKKWVDQGAKNN